MQPENPHQLTENPVVNPSQDDQHVALLCAVARQSALLRRTFLEDGEGCLHPFSRQFLGAEDLDRALPDHFRAWTLKLVGLLR